MVTKDVMIINRKGLHARASASLVKLAQTFKADVSVEKDGVSVSSHSIMGLMMLAAAKGDTIKICADGPDAEAAITALFGLVSAGFYEKD